MTGIPRVAVVGSLVSDFVVWLPHLPRRHETLAAQRVERHLGGKGFNQAVTASRCGASVAMIGRAGADGMGDAFLAAMEREGIDASGVARDQVLGTGMAVPMVLPDGDNSIVLLPQANTALDEADIGAAREAIATADALMLQLEVPVAASLAAAAVARASGDTLVLLNPAPARDDVAELVGLSDWILPNEVEAAALTGLPCRDRAEAVAAARALLEMGVRVGAVVTLGDEGCVCVTADGHVREANALAVEQVVDPTGAGDAFCGAFAVALLDPERSLDDALAEGCRAGAACVQVAGALGPRTMEQAPA